MIIPGPRAHCPDGTTNILSANNGLLGANYGIACSPDSQRTTFRRAATTPIALGTAPFAGSFPTHPALAVFAGKVRDERQRPLAASRHGRGWFGFERDCVLVAIHHPTLCTEGGG